jgi:hypothetical protein
MAFEHLNRDERAIAEAAVAKGIVPPDARYDVKVGEGFVSERFAFTEAELAMAKELTRKRIDAVVTTSAAVVLYEFTPRVSARVIGNLLAYKELYVKQEAPPVPVTLVLVVSERDNDLQPVLDKYGIRLEVV